MIATALSLRAFIIRGTVAISFKRHADAHVPEYDNMTWGVNNNEKQSRKGMRNANPTC